MWSPENVRISGIFRDRNRLALRKGLVVHLLHSIILRKHFKVVISVSIAIVNFKKNCSGYTQWLYPNGHRSINFQISYSNFITIIMNSIIPNSEFPF